MSDSVKHLRFVGNYCNVDFFKYTPTLFKPYFTDYPQKSHPHYEKHFAHKVRMFLEYIQGGYSVYYMRFNDEIIGHIVVANGRRRLAISDKEDIVLGPIFISPDMRRRGFGTLGINFILRNIDVKYRYAYEFIANDNIASIRTVTKNGYEFVCKAKEVGPMKKIVECADGDYRVYRYERIQTNQ